jgi:hypothetical protein
MGTMERGSTLAAKAKPAEYDLPFSTWSLAKLADFLVAARSKLPVPWRTLCGALASRATSMLRGPERLNRSHKGRSVQGSGRETGCVSDE